MLRLTLMGALMGESVGGLLPRPRRHLVVYLSGGFGLGIQTMQLFLVPLRANELGATPGQIGVILAFGAVAQAVLSIPGGWLIDRIGGRRAFIGGSAGSALAAACCAFTDSLLVLGLLLVLFTISRMLGWVASHAYITGYGAAEDGLKHAGRFAVATSLVSMAAPLGAGLVSDLTSIRSAFLLVAASAGLFVLVGVLLPEQPRVSGGETPLGGGDGLGGGVKEVVWTRKVAGGILLSGVDLWLYAIWTGFFPVALVNAGVSTSAAGTVVAVKNGVGVLGALLGHLGEKHGLTRERLGAGLLAVGVIGIAISPLTLSLPAAFLPAILFGVGSGAVTPISISIVGQAARRGLALGIRSTSNQISATLAPLLTGTLLGAAGLAVAFVSGALIGGSVLAVTFFGFLRSGSA